MNHKDKKIPSYQKNALLLILVLILVSAISLFWIVWHSKPNTSTCAFTGENTVQDDAGSTTQASSQAILIADIYQNGELLESITLSDVTEAYTFTVTGENGATNEVQVRPGSIGIISASCPDKLCVHQGFISSSLLPVTCLPNRLVIQVRTETIAHSTGSPSEESKTTTETPEIEPDIIAY